MKGEIENGVSVREGAETEVETVKGDPDANGKCWISFVADDLMRARLRVAAYRRGMTVSKFVRESLNRVLAEEARVDWRGKLGAGS